MSHVNTRENQTGKSTTMSRSALPDTTRNRVQYGLIPESWPKSKMHTRYCTCANPAERPDVGHVTSPHVTASASRILSWSARSAARLSSLRDQIHLRSRL